MKKDRIPNIQLRERREQHHLTQAALAEAVGVNTLTVGRWERGEATPTSYALKKLCMVLEATPQELGFEQEKEPAMLTLVEEEQPRREAPPRLTRRKVLLGAGAVAVALGIGATVFTISRLRASSQTSSGPFASLQNPAQQTLTHPLVYPGYAKPVRCVAWHPTDAYLATSSKDGMALIWQVDNSTIQATVSCSTPGAVSWVAWSPDGRFLALASDLQSVQVLPMYPLRDFPSNKCPAPYPAGQSVINSCAWSPDGRLLAAGGDDQMLRVWVVGTKKLYFAPLPINDAINTVDWSRDGRFILFGSDNSRIYLCDGSTGKLLSTYHGHTDHVNCVAWSPDSRHFASGSDDGTMRVWDSLTGRYSIHQVNTSDVEAVAWSADGRYLASGGAEGEGSLIHIWNAQTGAYMYACAGNTSKVNCVAWSHRGYRVASAGEDQKVRIWDLTRVLG